MAVTKHVGMTCFVSAFSWYIERKYWAIKYGIHNFKIIYFKLSTCSVCWILSFWWFSGIWILCFEVSEHPVCFIFTGGVSEHCHFHLLRLRKFGGSLHHLWRCNWQCPKRPQLYTTYEDGTDTVFRNVGTWDSDVGELPKRKNIILKLLKH